MSNVILKNDNAKETPQVNAINPIIVVTGSADKPYYEVVWFDVDFQDIYVGFGSYDLATVHGWLETNFTVTVDDNVFDIDRSLVYKNSRYKTDEVNKDEVS